MERKKVYGYIRVSTETQADKGYSLQTQENAIREYCDKHNMELLNIYRDEGISGTMTDHENDLSKRPGITELLNTLNGTNSIIVMNTSRLWRNGGAQLFISRSVRKIGGEIYSIEQPKYSLYSKDPQDFLMQGMLEMLDEYERLATNMRLANGRATKARKGYKPAGRLPYGYKYDPTTKHAKIETTEARVVEKIFTMYANGESFPAMVAKLNRNKPRPRSGIDWNKQSTQVLLRNDFYIGILRHQNEMFEGKHEPIISLELWERVQERKKRDSNNGKA